MTFRNIVICSSCVDDISWWLGHCHRKCPDTALMKGLVTLENFEGLPDQNKHSSSIRNKRSNPKSSLSWKKVSQWMKLSGWRKQLSVCVIKICLDSLGSWHKLGWWATRLSLIGQSPHPWPLIGRTALLSRCGPGVDLLTSSHHNPRGFPDNSLARSPARVVLKLSFLATSKSLVPQAIFTSENTSWNPKKYCKWFLTSCISILRI